MPIKARTLAHFLLIVLEDMNAPTMKNMTGVPEFNSTVMAGGHGMAGGLCEMCLVAEGEPGYHGAVFPVLRISW